MSYQGTFNVLVGGKENIKKFEECLKKEKREFYIIGEYVSSDSDYILVKNEEVKFYDLGEFNHDLPDTIKKLLNSFDTEYATHSCIFAEYEDDVIQTWKTRDFEDTYGVRLHVNPVIEQNF